MWTHVHKVYDEDSVRELRKTKLTEADINITSFAKMKVNLAAQVTIIIKVMNTNNFRAVPVKKKGGR